MNRIEYDNISQLPEPHRKQAAEMLARQNSPQVERDRRAGPDHIPDVGNMVTRYHSETESAFQITVINLLKGNGWRVHAERKARSAKGWMTPIQGDTGFPDIVAVRPPRIIFAELKGQAGKIEPEQYHWLMMVGHCEMVETYCWRPADIERIKDCVR